MRKNRERERFKERGVPFLQNASLCGAVWPEPVPVVPCLSWSTASSAFTQVRMQYNSFK